MTHDELIAGMERFLTLNGSSLLALHDALQRRLKDDEPWLNWHVKREREQYCKLSCPKVEWDMKTTVKIIDRIDCFDKLPIGTETISFYATVKNEDEIRAHHRQWNLTPQHDFRPRHSVTYYRFNGLLCHCNGGWILLNEPSMVSDEEWQGMKSGIIPEHLQHNL